MSVVDVFRSSSTPVQWTGALLLAALFLGVLTVGFALPFLDWRLSFVPLLVFPLFDYLLRLRWSDRGPRAARRVTEEILRGLFVLCEEIERGRMRRLEREATTSVTLRYSR